MAIFYIPNPTRYLNYTITINKQQIGSLLRQKLYLMVC